MWLVSEAAWKEHKTRGVRGPVHLQRGEFCHSVRFMASAWGWPKTRVTRFINKLKNRDTIRDAKRDNEPVYYIKNYNKFQIVGVPNRDSDRDSDWDKTGTVPGQYRDKLEKGEEREKGENICVASNEAPVSANGADTHDRLPIKKAFDNWNLIAQELGLPIAEKLTPDRRRKLRQRLSEHSLDDWNRALRNIADSEFLLGKGNRGWRASLDFMLQPSSFMKVLEGQYADKEAVN